MCIVQLKDDWYIVLGTFALLISQIIVIHKSTDTYKCVTSPKNTINCYLFYEKISKKKIVVLLLFYALQRFNYFVDLSKML